MTKLLKIILLSLICFPLFIIHCSAQISLIKDGSFEDTVTNWRQIYGYNSLKTWSWYSPAPGGVPMSAPLFTADTNAIISPYILPNNSLYNINARSGHNAQDILTYGGFAIYIPTGFGWGLGISRTPIRTKLRTKLVAGKQYCATLYAAAYVRQSYYATNGLGMYFDNGGLDTVFTVLKDSSGDYGKYATPQVISMAVIADSNHWQKVQGVFTATGTEQYLTIANWLSDTTMTKVLNGPLPVTYYVTEVLLDDVSVIPIDINHWLHDTTITLGDSLWVGLDKYDYTDGKWYTATMQYLSTGAGFWYKPTTATTTFIQSIDVCGQTKYDTMRVYAYPLGIGQLSVLSDKWRVYPNPASNRLYVELIAKHLPPTTKKEIYNALGQLLLTTQSNEIDVQTFSKGLYYIKIENEVQKVVLE